MAQNSTERGRPRVDRRVRRTRRALQEALIGLALERGYQSLTIEDLTERADVARATFYLHFADKDDLLVSVADDVIGELVSSLTKQRASDHGTVVRLAFAHAAARPDAYRLLLSGAGDGRALHRALTLAAEYGQRMIADTAARQSRTLRLPVDAVARLWSGELIMAIGWWVSGESGYTAEQVADFLLRERFFGLAWVYGSDPGNPELAAEVFGTDHQV